MKIGRITIIEPDRPAANQEKIGPEIERTITAFFMEPSVYVSIIVPAEPEKLRAALVRLCDEEKCPLVLTLGSNGPGLHDIAPETTRQILHRELPGFGEIMRYYSYERVKNAALSRATAGIRGNSLIINLPSRPKGVKFCLKLLQEAISEGLEYLTGKRPELRGDEIVVPLEKYLPFLKWLKPKLDPAGEKHPSL